MSKILESERFWRLLSGMGAGGCGLLLYNLARYVIAYPSALYSPRWVGQMMVFGLLGFYWALCALGIGPGKHFNKREKE